MKHSRRNMVAAIGASLGIAGCLDLSDSTNNEPSSSSDESRNIEEQVEFSIEHQDRDNISFGLGSSGQIGHLFPTGMYPSGEDRYMTVIRSGSIREFTSNAGMRDSIGEIDSMLRGISSLIDRDGWVVVTESSGTLPTVIEYDSDWEKVDKKELQDDQVSVRGGITTLEDGYFVFNREGHLLDSNLEYVDTLTEFPQIQSSARSVISFEDYYIVADEFGENQGDPGSLLLYSDTWDFLDRVKLESQNPVGAATIQDDLLITAHTWWGSSDNQEAHFDKYNFNIL